MPTVWIPIPGQHDYSMASDFGNLAYLCDTNMARADLTRAIREFKPVIEENYAKEDWLVVTGPPTIFAMAAVLVVQRHGVLNLLVYQPARGEYVPRNVKFW